MDVRSLAFRTDLALLRAGGSSVEDRGTHLVVRSPATPDFFWGNFVLLAEPPVPGGARELLDVFRAEFPDARHVAVGIDGVGEVDVSEFVAAGCDDEVGTVMTARTLTPGLTVDAELRPLDGDDDWAAWVDLGMTDTEFEPVMHRRYLEGRAVVLRGLVASGRGRWWGAFVGDALVSSLGCFAVGDGLARYQSVLTHPDHRRRGLAGALVRRAGLDALARVDVDVLVMVADPVAEAIRVYRACGFEVTEHQTQVQRRPDLP